jgi:tetratricopeptide (TPR) repeat protein
MIGLMLGFIVSFAWTRSYNKNNATTSSPSESSGLRGGSDNQQAMMAQVRETVEKATKNPRDYEAQVAAALVFNQIGRSAEAADYLKKALEINPNSEDRLGMSAYIGKSHLEEREYTEAEKWFRRASEIDPTEGDIYVEIAATFIQREPPVPDKAIEELQRALRLNPKNVHALQHLVEAYALKKDVSSADQTLARLKEAEPTNRNISPLQKMIDDAKAGRPVTVLKD